MQQNSRFGFGRKYIFAGGDSLPDLHNIFSAVKKSDGDEENHLSTAVR